ncbi:MAG: ATP-binding protein [Deltaproteobacteria bacterium]|nr:ATP-binding protein [Deltaproteobacteria bacterium]MBW1815760.1 ATP-binding protein [Deltaproteobacteria bacterium]
MPSPAPPQPLPDCRDIAPAKVHSDFAVRFDANAYTVPPWAVGKTFLSKALAYAACNSNIKVLFTTAIDMINHLV